MVEVYGDQEADPRDLLMHAGAVSLQGLGASNPDHDAAAAHEVEEPIPVQDGERQAPDAPQVTGDDAGNPKTPVAIRHATAHPEAVDDMRRQIPGSRPGRGF